MADLLTRKCGGCNTVLKLRQSCKRCADAARARLHAEGKGVHEVGGVPYGNMKPLVGKRPAWLDGQRGLHGLRVVERTREEWAELYKPRGLGCDEVTTYDPMLHEHIKAHAGLLNEAVRGGRLVISEAGKELAERMRNTPGKTERFVAVDPGFDDSESVAITMQRWADGTLVVEDVQRLKPPAQCEHPQLRKDYTSGTCPDCEGTVSWFRDGTCFAIGGQSRREGVSTSKPPAKHEPPPVGAEVSRASYQRCHCVECRFERMEITTAQRAWYWARHHSEPCTKRHVPTDGTPPDVGAEVSWERAKRDMQARSEARYNHIMFRMRSPDSEYAWVDGRLVTNGGRQSGEWQASCYSEVECADPQRRWVRLA